MTLKPCPFCGSENVAVSHDWDSLRFVACGNCEAEGPIVLTFQTSHETLHEMAVAAWNTRADERKAGRDATD